MSEDRTVMQLVERSRKAFRTIEFADQQTVDDICGKIAWETTREGFIDTIARQSYEITGLGSLEDKYRKMGKIKAIYHSMKDARTCGMIEADPGRTVCGRPACWAAAPGAAAWPARMSISAICST